MKKTIISLSILLFVGNSSTAQETPVEVKYRRSSLHTMVLESEKFPNKEIVLKAFNTATFPDKYNDHQIGAKSFNPANYLLTAEEKATVYTPSKAGKLAAAAASTAGVSMIDSVAKELPNRIGKFLENEKIANQLVAKWFNMKADGAVDDLLIGDRGAFNASFLDTKIANASNDGKELLRQAGNELIPNTFVVVNKFKFIENEPVARLIRDAAKVAAAKKAPAGPLLDKSYAALDLVYEKTKEGFTIWATSYLYKLIWNDTIAQKFYNWIDDKAAPAEKKRNFDKSSDYKLEFVGDETASGLVTFSLKEKRTEEQIIILATHRIIDKVYSKLQRTYDVFKTKTPLYTGYPITAKIGLKEGLEAGDKFEVLEQNIDQKTGVSTYKSLGKIKVEKEMIWDNMQSTGEVPVVDPVVDPAAKPAPVLDRTTFSGGKKYYSGLLIRQLK